MKSKNLPNIHFKISDENYYMNIDLDGPGDIVHNSHVIHHCATCLREIINEAFVTCIRCRGLTICLECFSDGYEKEGHLKDHPFVLMGSTTGSIFEEFWTIEEELIFLTAIQLCGFGNWSDISSHIGTKSARQCEAHYDHIYLITKNAPLPDIELKQPAILPPLPSFNTIGIESNPSDGHPQIMAENHKLAKTTPAEVCEYMPRRHEFDIEFNNEAEHLIDGLFFDEDSETEQSFEMKLANLVSFNDQIVERKLRTKVVEEWDLQYAPNFSLGSNTPTEKEIENKVIPFAPYLGKSTTISMLDAIWNYNRQCERIGKLMFWQKNGVKSYYEGFIFQKLGSLIKENKIPQQNVEEWNKGVKEYIKTNQPIDNSDQKIMSKKENELCKKYRIHSTLYFGLKDLIIRESTVRGFLTKKQAVKIDTNYSREIEIIYDFCYESGWIF
ncbi:Myb-like DNA-binding domain containing protein [Tritrichomonas foetus]|uniref:Myb-like DNA-binding domain containing protein n=1 Tax=Tritrichomonas foetus TaxID=1144522 RepID=A0A1J4K2T2_9EUKA|nr:Myb-like DNA-binding domain containing protein [Tritrichomonas foetus]|eukprot:OHT05507.1 Myb-like DNA-binding domain containing protein [Tritrichomonas foetus]